MTRLIPGKTKVDVEFFRGVTLGDLIVAGIGAAMIIFVLISTLPYKLAICVGVAAVAGLLLIRIDEQANYVYILHILSHFSYDRRFAKRYSDKMLLERGSEHGDESAFDALFREDAETGETKASRRSGTKADRAAEKARKLHRRREDKMLKSAQVPEEEKEAIRARRARESEEAQRAMADAKDAAAHRQNMDLLLPFTALEDGCIVYGNKEYYGAAIEIDPVEFRFFSENRRRNSIENGLGRILRAVNAKYSANIVKLERPIRYEGYLQKEYDKLDDLQRSYENGMLDEDEVKARVEVEYDRINELLALCSDNKVVTDFYYLVLFESDKRQLELQMSNALASLTQGELAVHRLDDRELAVFLKYTNALDFDETEIDRIAPEDYAHWAKPEIVDIKARRVEVNHIVTHNLRAASYPALVGDAWLAGVMSIPGTKVVVKAKPMDRQKAIRGIDRSLMELRGQWSATGVDSKRMEIETHLATLQELLTTLQSDSESLLEVNVYITAYDITATRNNLKIKQPPISLLPTIADMKKAVRRTWQESGFRLANMEFDQMEAFIGSQVNGLDPVSKRGRGIPSNTIAACYPWIYAHISDEGGVKLGESDGIPVFIDFFRRDSERVNSNMVIVGKSGSGKSYATKSILSNLAADDAKIFILDPENEYSELAGNLHGKIINVGNAQHGRLNPFHIITALDDDEAGEGGPSGSYATHLQFLEEFFRQILPDCDKDSMEYLNSIVDRLYSDFGITAETDLSTLAPEDYPIFDDLYDSILREFQSTDNEYIRTMLRNLMNYIAKFSTGGRNANIWNGPSTVTTDTNFTVFNFQSMLANRNQTIANAQMLLVLKYIDNEIIKNRDYNTKYGLHRKVVVVIDEAHVFIDAKYPIALDFMFQLAKRIRKYNGMQIVITQNIKDFVGSEEIARKSTAIINACQYSFIFALAPNDIQDLVKLYENAGGINESEQEQIVQAPRGQAFTIMSPTSRSTFRVETGESMIRMFQSRDFVSRYFTGEEGGAKWEDFIASSRAAHEKAVAERKRMEGLEGEAAVLQSSVAFREFDRADYETPTNEEEAPPAAKASAVQFTETEHAGGFAAAEAAPTDTSMSAMMGALTGMFGNMSEAFRRMGRADAFEPAGEPPLSADADELRAQEAARRERDAELNEKNAELSEKDAEIERLRRRLEQLESAAAQEDTAAGPADVRQSESEGAEDLFEELETPRDEPADDSGMGSIFDRLFEDGAPADHETAPEAAESAAEESEEVEKSEETVDGESDFDILAFLEGNMKRTEPQVTVFDRMRIDGQSSAPMTLKDLIAYLDSKTAS